jgi:LPXTG-site transpeptidase (sortase) family protein
MNRLKATFALGIVLLVGGYGLLVYTRNHEATINVAPDVSSAVQLQHSASVIEGDPVRLQIPSLHMDLAVIKGYYSARTKQWTLTNDKVQYATITPKPNSESGDTFLYGHYRREVFANLHTIPTSAIAMVKTSNGHTFYYRLDNVKVVSPQQSASIFNYRGKPLLTLQTCTGLFYQNRQLFTFRFYKVV